MEENEKNGEERERRRRTEYEEVEVEDDGGLSSACHCSQARQKAVCIIMGCHLISHERGKEVAVYVRARIQGWEVIGARSLLHKLCFIVLRGGHRDRVSFLLAVEERKISRHSSLLLNHAMDQIPVKSR